MSENSKLQLVPSIKPCELWCQVRALLLIISLACKMSASKSVHYFPSHPAASGFEASSPFYNFTLNPSNKNTDQILSDFQTGIVVAVLLCWIQSSLHLVPKLHWLIPLFLYRVLMRGYYSFRDA